MSCKVTLSPWHLLHLLHFENYYWYWSLELKELSKVTLIRQYCGKNSYFSNRPFPSSKNTQFQNEPKCKSFLAKMSFICISIKSAFHNNGFAPRLALKQRRGGNSKMAYWSLEDCFELLTVITSLKPAEKRNTTCMIHVVFQMDFHWHVSFVCVRQGGFPLSHNVYTRD